MQSLTSFQGIRQKGQSENMVSSKNVIHTKQLNLVFWQTSFQDTIANKRPGD